MTRSLSEALGLLRELAPHVVKDVIPVDPAVQAYMQSHGLTEPPGGAGDRINIRPDGREAFQKLSECIIRQSTAMERGVKFASVQTELLGYVGAYAGRDPGTIAHSDAKQLRNHFVSWFDKGSTPRRVFVPCALSRWQSNEFVIGPVSFFFIGKEGFHTFYTPGTQLDAIAQTSFIDLLKLMKETRTERMARVEIEGCDHERAQDVGELAVDLAIVAFQLAEPYLGTRNMCRLDSRRGAAEKRVVTEANRYYNAGWTLLEPGCSIGTGTLDDMLKRKAGLFTAVGNTIRGFTTGHFRLPVLETAWCDAAYWLHQALAESIDNIAVAKLETALEVLLRAESGPGSEARILAVLDCFFGLQPGHPIRPGSKLTAKQFAKNMVRDRSRILHGTWSTLNLRPGLDRKGMEGFTINVLRSAVLELDAYCQQAGPPDNVDAFLGWIRRGGRQHRTRLQAEPRYAVMTAIDKWPSIIACRLLPRPARVQCDRDSRGAFLMLMFLAALSFAARFCRGTRENVGEIRCGRLDSVTTSRSLRRTRMPHGLLAFSSVSLFDSRAVSSSRPAVA